MQRPLVAINVAADGPVTVELLVPMFRIEHTESTHSVMTTRVAGVTSGIVALNISDAFKTVDVPVKSVPGNE